MDTDQVILVDEKDRFIGVAQKMEAHQKGLLHRAFSIFIFNTKGEMLLQQRALDKYHSGGLWTNACCSHPNPGEEIPAAVKRRLKEEIGIETPVEKIFDLIYKAELDNGLTENEFDHVFAGEYDDEVEINRNEVMDFCYKDIQDIRDSLQMNPEKYTAWFQLAFPGIEEWWKRRYKNKVA
jgi:isopentenyl-diphosphate delta-isomerase